MSNVCYPDDGYIHRRASQRSLITTKTLRRLSLRKLIALKNEMRGLNIHCKIWLLEREERNSNDK